MVYVASPPARLGQDESLFWSSGPTRLGRLNLDPSHQDRKDGGMLGVPDSVVVACWSELHGVLIGAFAEGNHG